MRIVQYPHKSLTIKSKILLPTVGAGAGITVTADAVAVNFGAGNNQVAEGDQTVTVTGGVNSSTGNTILTFNAVTETIELRGVYSGSDLVWRAVGPWQTTSDSEGPDLSGP